MSIFATLLVVAYAALIAFGRGGFIAPDSTWPEAAWYAKNRFHFWWIAAFIPAIWVGWWELARLVRPRARLLADAGLAAVALFVLIPKSLIPWDYAPGFHKLSTMEAHGAVCLVRALRDRPGEPLVCPLTTGTDLDERATFERIFADHPALWQALVERMPEALNRRALAADERLPPAAAPDSAVCPDHERSP